MAFILDGSWGKDRDGEHYHLVLASPCCFLANICSNDLSIIIIPYILNIITKQTSLVTISIGSGIAADAQFLFAEDILGQSEIAFPRHAKKYKNFNKILDDIQKERILAFKQYKKDVQQNKYPTKKHVISIDKIELNNFRKFLKKN